MLFDFEMYEKLLDRSNLYGIEQQYIIDRLIDIERDNDDEMNEFYQLELQMIYNRLKENQLDPITHGRGYNATDIRKHLKKLS